MKDSVRKAQVMKVSLPLNDCLQVHYIFKKVLASKNKAKSVIDVRH